MKDKQTQRILRYMEEHGSISQKEAIELGCYRLSARIHDLKREGHSITMERKGFRNEYGCGHFAVYRLN